MSKNTERGIGQHVGPAADGRPDDTRPRRASETSTVGPPSPRSQDRDGKVPKVEVAQITLLGVSAPDLDREKATTPGRDVHLPTEARRVAAPRAVALDSPASPPSSDRRKTPDAPRPRVTAVSVPSIPLNTQDVISTVNARLSETGEVARPARRPAGRRDFAETTLMDAVPETGRGASIALGIAISLVAAVAVVWTLRFGPHLRGFEAAVADRPPAASDPASRAPSPTRELRLPALRGATAPSVDGELPGANPSAAPAAPRLPSPEEAAAARGAPVDDDPSASRENPGGAQREARSGASAGSGAPDEDGRRRNPRLRTAPPSAGERVGSSAASKRPPAPPIFRETGAPGPLPTAPPPVGSGRVASPEPPRFESPPPPSPPAAAPVRPAPANEKSAYDPDSPLPPAAGE